MATYEDFNRKKRVGEGDLVEAGKLAATAGNAIIDSAKSFGNAYLDGSVKFQQRLGIIPTESQTTQGGEGGAGAATGNASGIGNQGVYNDIPTPPPQAKPRSDAMRDVQSYSPPSFGASPVSNMMDEKDNSFGDTRQSMQTLGEYSNNYLTPEENKSLFDIAQSGADLQRQALGEGSIQRDISISPEQQTFNQNMAKYGSAESSQYNPATGSFDSRTVSYTQDAEGRLFKRGKDGAITELDYMPSSEMIKRNEQAGLGNPQLDEKRNRLEEFYTNLMKTAGDSSRTGRTVNLGQLNTGRAGLEALRAGDIDIGKANLTAEGTAATLANTAKKTQFELERDARKLALEQADTQSQIGNRSSETILKTLGALTGKDSYGLSEMTKYAIAKKQGLPQSTVDNLGRMAVKELKASGVKAIPESLKNDLDPYMKEIE